MDSYRSRRHCLLLYPDDSTHVKAKEYIERYFNYAYILHDKDKQKDSEELKKEHWHFVIQFQNAQYNTAVAKELGINPNYIQECRNMDKALEYLIHWNEETKHQYGFSEVKGPLKKKLAKLLEEETVTEDMKAQHLIEYILNYPGYLSASQLALAACHMDRWSAFRRASSIYLRILDDHNEQYAIKEWKEVKYED